MRERTDFTTIAARPSREVASQAASELSRALSLLGDAGVDIPSSSRLHQAKQLLESAAVTGAIIPEHTGDYRGLQALELAFDYAAIADTLPSRRNAALWRELRDSVRGDLSPPASNRQPLQLQAQAIVRAAFVVAGLSPQLPTHSARTARSAPDLTLDNGTLRYAIEVKRPEKAHNVLSRLRDARDQLSSFGFPGGILIDVTDCVRGLSDDALSDEVRRLSQAVTDEIHVQGDGQRSEYANVIVAGCFARAAWTTVQHASGEAAEIQVQSCLITSIYASRPGTLRAHHANWIRRGFQDGVDLLFQRLGDAAT